MRSGNCRSRTDTFAPEVMFDLRRWVCKIGYSLEPHLFPYLQLGMVCTQNQKKEIFLGKMPANVCLMTCHGKMLHWHRVQQRFLEQLPPTALANNSKGTEIVSTCSGQCTRKWFGAVHQAPSDVSFLA